MVLIYFIIILLLALGLAALWWFPLGLLLRDRLSEPEKPTKAWLKLHLLLSVAICTVCLIVTPAWIAILSILIPWFGLLAIEDAGRLAWEFGAASCIIGGTTGILGVAISFLAKHNRRFAIRFLAILAACATAYWHAEFKSRFDIATAAQAIGLETYTRRSLRWSFMESYEPFRGPHANGVLDGKWYLYSYREKAFICSFRISGQICD